MMEDELSVERRGLDRVESTIVTQLLFSDNKARQYGFIKDISECGIAVVTPFPVKVKEHLSLRFDIPHPQQKVMLFCYVVYCHQQPHDLFGQTSYRCGLKMMDPTPEIKILIRNYLDYIQAKDSPHFDHSILLVSESRSVQYLLTNTLVSAGFKVDSAMDAIQAVEAFGFKTYDLTIVDLSMPEENGIKVAQKIRAINPEAKLIFSSSLDCQKNRDMARDFSADLYIIKPTNCDQFLEMVANKLHN